jgi:OOP family OmpA-OmpF porin
MAIYDVADTADLKGGKRGENSWLILRVMFSEALQQYQEGGNRMKSSRRIFLLAVIAFVTLTFLVGCSGRIYAPREGSIIWYYHHELPEAAQAVEDAQKVGKDNVCPDEFQAVKDLMEEAYRTYWACRTEEAIKMAKDATVKAKALCPLPAACTLTASPKEIEKGKSTTLIFTTSGAVKSAMLDGEAVAVTGATKTVSPTITTTYTGQVTGVGGTQKATATVTVISPASAATPAPAQPKVTDRMSLKVNFDSDKFNIRKADEAKLDKAVEFVKKHPNSVVKIEGHTDSIGTEEYNQKLSERRAEAVKNYFIKKGATKTNISITGYGESKPIAENKTAKGRAENRRAEILILK